MKTHSVAKAIADTTTAIIPSKSGSRTERKKYARTFDVEVYSESLPRALKILKSILKEAHSLGVSIVLRGTRYWLRLNDRLFKVQMSQGYKQVYVTGRAWPEHVRGELKFRIFPPELRPYFSYIPKTVRDFSDDKTGNLEKKIKEIAAAFPDMLKEQIADEKEQDEEHARRSEESRLRRIQEDWEKAPKENLKDLLKAARMWKASQELQEFLDAARIELSPPLEKRTDWWLKNCQEVIDKMNPLKDGIKPWENLATVDGETAPPLVMGKDAKDPFEILAKMFEKKIPSSWRY